MTEEMIFRRLGDEGRSHPTVGETRTFRVV